MEGLKKGDQVIARSKTDKFTVISGMVDHVAAGYLMILPTGHRSSHGCTTEAYSFEKVSPPIEFGQGAVVKHTPSGDLYQRGVGNTWYSLSTHPQGVPRGDSVCAERYLTNSLEVYFWGVGVTPPEGWVAP